MTSLSSFSPLLDPGLKVSNGFFQSPRQGHLGLPLQPRARPCYIRSALFRVVLGQRFEHQLAPRTGGADNFLRKFEHGHLSRIANIHRLGMSAHHQRVNAFNQIGDVAETPRLPSIAKNSDRLVFEGLACAAHRC